MNDVLKAFSRLLEPFGYRIRPSKGFNFLTIPNLDTQDTTGLSRVLDLMPPKGCLDNLTIYLRTCMRENRNARVKNIPGGGTLVEATERCIHSLVQSINHAAEYKPEFTIKLIVLDDRSEEPLAQKIKDRLKDLKTPFEFRVTDKAGQGPSLHQAFVESKQQDGMVYFVEDDYLHETDAIYRLCEFYGMMTEKTGSHLLLYPQEHTTIYSNHYPSYIVAGADRHWRTIRHATHTFFTHGNVVKEYWRYFENTKYVGDPKKRQKGSEAKTTNKLFQHIPGFSPMRPCAVHFQNVGLLPPLYDWQKLWEKNDFKKHETCVLLKTESTGLAPLT